MTIDQHTIRLLATVGGTAARAAATDGCECGPGCDCTAGSCGCG